MARGKITEYEQGSFASSASGTPGIDKSGQILAQGAEALGRGVESFGQSLGQVLQRRQDASDSLTAMDKFGEFQFQHAQKKLELQQKYRDKPLEYATAAKEMSEKLAEDFSKDTSGGASKKFKMLTTNAIAQDMDNNVQWAFKRDSEIQLGKINSIKQNIALKASTVTSAQELAAIYGDFQAVSPEAQKFISPEDDTKLTKTYWELAKKNAMYAQIYARPNAAYRDLEGGAYNGVLTPQEIAEFTSKARTALQNRAEDDMFRSTYMAQGKLLDMQNGLDNGSVSITDLITEREAAYANKNKLDANGKPVISPEYIRGLDNLVDSATYSRLRLPANKEARKNELKKFDTDWDAYLQEKKTAGDGPTEEDINKELSVYANLSKLYKEGTITKADFDEKTSIMRTKLSLRQGQKARVKSFSEVVDQAGTVPNFWWRSPGNDVLSLGYQMIKDHVDKMYPESTDDERRDVKAQMLAQYNQFVTESPEDQIKGMQTENQRKEFAHRAIFGATNSKGEQTPGILRMNSTYKNPVTQQVFKAGDTTTDAFGNTKIFAGKSPTGKPIWRYKPGQIIKGPNNKKALVKPDGTLEQQ